MPDSHSDASHRCVNLPHGQLPAVRFPENTNCHPLDPKAPVWPLIEANITHGMQKQGLKDKPGSVYRALAQFRDRRWPEIVDLALEQDQLFADPEI